jgi:hypothetical protein
MTVLSFGLQWIPGLYNWFTVDDRLAGFFQYPNTYALYLILGLIELSYMEKQRYKAIKPVLAIVLFAGLLASGSRTAFLLAVVLGILRGLVASGKKQKIIMVAGVGILAAVAVGIASMFPSSAIGRYLMISTQSSTFLGRFLYFQDALPVILKNPLGLGYMGYYYSQGSFQTGVYSVMYVHNDLLQLLLDIGWLPTVLVVVFFVRQLFQKHSSWEKRLLLLAIFAHSMLDFNLQFAAIWLLLMLIVDGGTCFKVWEISSKGAAQAIGAVLAAISLSFGVASFSETYLSPSSTLMLYPNDTAALITRLTEVSSTEDMETLADRILRLDSSVSIAHSAKASVAYSEGDIEEMAQQKQLAIDCARYAQDEYQDYFDKLESVIAAYEAQGAEDSAAYCVGLLQGIPGQMQAVLEGTNPLAWRITDTPELSLTAEQNAYLNRLK